jgi:hypothetical protein
MKATLIVALDYERRKKSSSTMLSGREFRWKNMKEKESSQALIVAMVFDRMPSVITKSR